MTPPENLATLSQRISAAMIDGALYAIPVLIGMMVFFPVITEQMSQAYSIDLTNPQQIVIPPRQTATVFLPAFVVFLVQAFLLARSGQSIGKKALGITIVRVRDGLNGGLWTNVILRMIFNSILGFIPFYSILDLLFIFRDNRRCLHDELAGTMVVKTALAA